MFVNSVRPINSLIFQIKLPSFLDFSLTSLCFQNKKFYLALATGCVRVEELFYWYVNIITMRLLMLQALKQTHSLKNAHY